NHQEPVAAMVESVGLQYVPRAQRRIQRVSVADRDPKEPLLRDSDNTERMAGETHRAPDDGWIAAVLAAPDGVAEHRDRGTPAVIVGGCEQSARGGLHAEGGEELATDIAAAHGTCKARRRKVAAKPGRHGEHAGERSLSIAERLPGGIGE